MHVTHNRGAMKGAISSGFIQHIESLGRFDFAMFFPQQVWLGECEKIVSVDMMKRYISRFDLNLNFLMQTILSNIHC